MRKDFTPREYQKIALSHMLEHERCALWAGMGMGKTISTLNALDALHLAGEDRPTLVLAPLRVARSTWPNEAAKWNHLRHISVIPIVGTETERLAALRHDVSVYTTNYENLEWLVDHFGERWPFKTVVSDEATRLKNQRVTQKTSSLGKTFYSSAGGRRAGALGKIAHVHMTRFIELTGTPSPNGLADLWGQIWFLDGGKRLGRTHTAFKDRWFRPKHDGYGSEPLEHAEQQIYDAISDLCLTLDPADWFDLEAPIVNNVYVDLPRRAAQLYKDMEKEMYCQIEDHHAEAFNAAARTQKCMQLANGAIYTDPMAQGEEDPRSKQWKVVHDEKIEALDSIREETGGSPLLVAYEFKSDLARLLKAFPKGRVLKTTKDEDDFKAGKIPMLFAHPKSASHGIDGFQYVCNNVVFFGQSWNLEEYQQMIERVGPVRQAQAETGKRTFTHHILARGTVDEIVMERRESKKSVQDCLLEAMKRN